MKCPCCESALPADTNFFYVDKRIYIDGEWYFIPPSEGKLLHKLWRNIPVSTDRKRNGSTAVFMSRLREFFRDTGMPYIILVIGHHYVLRSTTNVQNNNHAQRSEDVHS